MKPCRTREEVRDMRRPPRKALFALAGLMLAAIFWRELPALKRYIKIERM